MTKALYIPGADRTSRWFGGAYPNQFVFDHLEKSLFHSTETRKTSGCPGYSGGANAPVVTFNPWPGYFNTWHHWQLNRAGRALGNPSSTPVSENKDYVFQFEIIGFSDPALGRQYNSYLPELPEEGLDWLADKLAFVHREWGHSTTLPLTWPLYKVSSWAAMEAAHMSSAAYDAHRGWLAHLHAPKPSTHGDSALNIRSLKAKVDALLGSTEPIQVIPAYSVLEDDGYFGGKSMRALAIRLAQKGFYKETLFTFTDTTPALTAALQRYLNSIGVTDKAGNKLTVDGRGFGSNNSGRYPEEGYTRTMEAVEKRLGRTGSTINGAWLPGSYDAVMFQRRLNANTF